MKLIIVLSQLLMLTSCLNKIGVAKFDREDGAFLFSDLPAQNIATGSLIAFDVDTINGTDTHNGKNISYNCSYDNATDGLVDNSANDCSVLSISFNAATGQFAWTPSGAQAGTYEIKITATANGQTKDLFFETVVTATDSAPSISSIVRKTGQSNPTNATSIIYTVNFSEAVTNVDTADFSITTTGTATGNILSVASISASQYEVTVDTVAGDGTIRLNLIDTNVPAIQDSANQTLSNIPFITGQTFTIDNTAPEVTSIVSKVGDDNPTNATTARFTVTFSEAVTPVVAADFALSTTGPIYTTFTVTIVSTTVYDITVNGISGAGDIRLNLADANSTIRDTGNNALSPIAQNGDEWVTIVSPVEVSALTAKVKTGNSIELSWTGDATYYDSYVIAYNYGTTPPADCTSSDEFIPHTSITGSSHLLTGLGNTWDYAFRVCATYTDGTFETAGITVNKKLILADIGGNFYNFIHNNGYLYVSNAYDPLINIYSVATDDISESTWVGSINGSVLPSSIVVDGDYLYISSLVSDLSIDLMVYDISNPLNPSLATTISGPNLSAPNKMIKDGNYLYFLDATNLVILNATNPLDISYEGTANIGTMLTDIIVYNNTAHIATGGTGSGVYTVDVTNKAAPGAAVPYIPSGGAGDCHPATLVNNANIIFATCNNVANYGVIKYDADNLAGPTEFYTMVTEPHSLKLTSTHFYVSDSTVIGPLFTGGDIHVVAQNDLSTSISTILSPPNGGEPLQIYNNNRLLFASMNQLDLYNIAVPAAPVLLDSHIYSITAPTGMSIDFTNEILAASSMLELALVDISDLSSPVKLGTVPFVTGNFGHNAFIQNGYVYIPYAGTMSVYDVSDPLNPLALPSLVTSSTSFGSYNYFDNTTLNDYLIIAYNDSSYGVYDISNPASVTEVHHADSAYSIGTYYLPLTVSNGHIYVAIDDDSIGVINLGTLTQVATIDIAAGQLANANINGTTLYLSDSTDTITVVDITTPAAPSILGTYAHTNFFGTMTGMNSIGDRLILHFVYGSIEILDISAPIPTPVLVAENYFGYGYGFTWIDDDVKDIGYFFNVYGGISMIDYSDAPSFYLRSTSR